MAIASRKPGKSTSTWEEVLAGHFNACGFTYEREYRFGALAAGGAGKGLRDRLALVGLRDWRFDFAWPDYMIAVEFEGGTFMSQSGQKSRHTTGTGFAADCEKYNAAALLGWTVLRFTKHQVKSGLALNTVEKLLAQKKDL